MTSTLPLDDDDDDDDRSSDPDAAATHRSRRRDPTLAPEEVLFRRVGAPVRFAEKDIYHAHEALPDGGRDVLPDSDMVKAVHGYASHFYAGLAARRRGGDGDGDGDGDEEAVRGSEGHEGRRGGRQRRRRRRRRGKEGGEGKEVVGEEEEEEEEEESGNVDEQSMDETALLAFGILLEEAGREVLGRRGDLVFTEGVQVDEGGGPIDGGVGPVGFRDASRWRQQQRRSRRAPTRSDKREEEIE